MADIVASGSLDNTTVNCELSLLFSERRASSVKVSYTAVTYLNSSGYTGAGYEAYTAVINISGTGITAKSVSVTLKEKSEAWSGSAKHTVSGSFTLYLTTTGAVYPNVTYTVKSSADSVNSVYGSCSLTCAHYSAPIPSNPANITLSQSSLYYGLGLQISWPAVSGATGYKLYGSVNDGAWSLIATLTATSYTYTPNIDFNSNIRYKVCAYNASGASSGKVSGYLEGIGGLWFKASGAYKPCNVYIKAAGVWKRIKCAYVKINGSWCVSK